MRPEHITAYDAYIERWLDGLETGHRSTVQYALSRHVRRYMLTLVGFKCQQCGWDKRHPDDGSILLEIDHIDGDSSNTVLANLRVLCPNCHSMTPTYRGRNKKSARKR